MPRLFLFNPENDIALASGLPRITPPRHAAELHRAGAMIPFWLGAEEDYLLVAANQLEEALRWKEEATFAGPTPICSVAPLPADIDLIPTPWGWSPDAVSQFLKFGLAGNQHLPSAATLKIYRQLSSRNSQIGFLQQLQWQGIKISHPSPIATADINEVKRFVVIHGEAMLKSPWSSSGRGVFPVATATYRSAAARIEGIIRSQGCIMVEPMLRKLLDFALLYNLTDKSADFQGLSLFHTTTATNYGGNIVDEQANLRKRLLKYLTENELDRLVKACSHALYARFGGKYQGPIGIDMMVYAETDGTPAIAPCIEINMRYTMGFVALSLWEKTGMSGIMTISPKGKTADNAPSLPMVPDNNHFAISLVVNNS